jgi:hypothetical protein
MMARYIPTIIIKIVLVMFLSFPELIYSQNMQGRILSSMDDKAIAYVNVVVLGKGVGTVSDMHGNFTLNLDKSYYKDSLQFSMIGYKSKTAPVRFIKNDSVKTFFLDPEVYDLQEVTVSVPKRKYKQIRLGKPVTSDVLRSGFADNTLGSELGIKVNVNCRVRLKELNLNVSVCTYDSVTYRLNIYQLVNQTEFENILTEPIYISFSREDVNNHISFDLSRYSIVVEGTVIVALQLYKDLGAGRLLFHTNFLTGSTQFRKTNDAKWAEATGEIGM